MSEQETQPEETQDVTEDTTDAQDTDAQEADEDGAEDSPEWLQNFDKGKALKRIREQSRSISKLKAKVDETQAERDQRIGALEAQNIRLEVALDLGLPKQIADRLKGNTREEMLADAEELMKLVGGPRTPTPRKPVEALRGGGQPEQEPEESDLRKLGERMFNR